MKQTLFITVLLMMLALNGCTADSVEVESLTAETAEMVVSEDFLAYNTDPFRNLGLSSFYERPEEVNLYQLFYNGFGLEIRESDREFVKQALEGTDLDIDSYNLIIDSYDLIKLPAEEMDRILTEYFGITLEQSKKLGLEKFYFCEDTGTYYLAHNDALINEIKIKEAFYEEDGTLCIIYTNPSVYEDKDCIVKLEKVGEGYHFLSNTLQNSETE